MQMRSVLQLNCDLDLDWLIALEFGRVSDGHPEDALDPICESFAYYFDEPNGRCIGFKALRFSELDLSDRSLSRLWDGTRFDAPLIALTNATAGEILLCAQTFFRSNGSINRDYFDAATGAVGWEAIPIWQRCLQCGDSMAHFGLGYTYLELGCNRLAYRHLRYYTEIAPAVSWNWCWFGKAAVAVGEIEEAVMALQQAIQLTAEGDYETDAPEVMAMLDPPSSAGPVDPL